MFIIILVIFSVYFYLMHHNEFYWTEHFGYTVLYMFNAILENYEVSDINKMNNTSTIVMVLYLCLTIIILLSLLVAIL